MSERVLSTDTVPLQVFVRLRGTDDPAPGETDVGLRAYSEGLGQFLDWADLTFKAAGHTTLTLILTDTPFATNAPGLYERSGGLDLTAVTNLAANDSLTFLAIETVGSDLDLPAPGMMKIDQWVEDIRTPVVANLDAPVSSRSTFNETTDPVELLASGGSAGVNADELVDLTWDEVLTGATHNVVNSSGRRIRELSDFGIRDEGQAQSGTSTTIRLASTAPTLDDVLNGAYVAIIGGTGQEQVRVIIDYDGTTKDATVDRAWSVDPDSSSEYVVGLAADSIPVSDLYNVIRDSILNDATRFAGADVGSILADTVAGGAGPWTTATGFAVPGDAMDLVTDAVDADALATSGLQEMADHLETDGTNPHGTGAWDATAIVPPQTIRDAMKLAPSAGVAAVDSIDGKLDEIDSHSELDVAYDNDTQTITITAGLERSGAAVTAPTAIAISWRDTDSTELFALDATDAIGGQDPDAAGEFRFTVVQALANDTTYRIELTITDALGSVFNRHRVMTAKGT